MKKHGGKPYPHDGVITPKKPGMTGNFGVFRVFTRGQAGYLFLLLLLGGAAALYFGYAAYLEKYFIRFYDGDMVKYLEIPPFATRLSPASHELFGQCKFQVSILPDQAAMVLDSSCQKRGFFFKGVPGGFEIALSPQYKIWGFFEESVLTMVWTPVLSESLKKKAAKLTAPSPIATASLSLKKKPMK